MRNHSSPTPLLTVDRASFTFRFPTTFRGMEVTIPVSINEIVHAQGSTVVAIVQDQFPGFDWPGVIRRPEQAKPFALAALVLAGRLKMAQLNGELGEVSRLVSSYRARIAARAALARRQRSRA